MPAGLPPAFLFATEHHPPVPVEILAGVYLLDGGLDYNICGCFPDHVRDLQNFQVSAPW